MQGAWVSVPSPQPPPDPSTVPGPSHGRPTGPAPRRAWIPFFRNAVLCSDNKDPDDHLTAGPYSSAHEQKLMRCACARALGPYSPFLLVHPARSQLQACSAG